MSIKSSIKDFLINRILPLTPAWILCWIFDKVMLPATKVDLNLLRPFYEREIDKYSEMRKNSLIPITKSSLVVGMVGLPQTGKTTAANVIMKETGYFCLNSNMVRGWLIDVHSDYGNIDAIVLYYMEYALRRYSGVILDSDCVLPGKRAFIEALAKRCKAGVEYVHVSVDHETWMARLKSEGHVIHRMYSDGIKRDPAYSNMNVIPTGRIKFCVFEERARQESGHNKYAGALEPFATFNNGGNIKELNSLAAKTGATLLSVYGK